MNTTQIKSCTDKKLESICRKALYDHKMLEEINSLAIALSGGKDSLTLLYLLNHILGRGFPKISLCAIHVIEKSIIGSVKDAKNLKKICETLKIKLVFINSDSQKSDCYSCSRKRRSLLFEKAKELGISTIAFAHHLDDNIQTLLLNLFHKGEFAGMLPKINLQKMGITIIRPLIYIKEAEIKNFVKRHGLNPAQGKCPKEKISKRKETNKLIKQIETQFPNIKTNLSSAIFIYGSNKASLP